MQPLRDAIAIGLCFSLCFPAPLGWTQQAVATDQDPAQTKHRQEYRSEQMRGDERIYQALNRFTFGPRPADVETVRQLGLERWFELQLHPATIGEADLNTRLAQFPAMQWGTQDLVFRLPSNAIIRQATNGKVAVPESGALHAVYENQIYRLREKKEKREQGNIGEAAGANGEAAGANMQANARATASAPAEIPGVPQPATAEPQETNAMTPAAAGQETAADEARIQEILNLAPAERVECLRQMQPEEFYGFLKSLRPTERQALTAGMSPGVRESVDALENPEQTVARELLAERLTRDIYSQAQLAAVMTDFWLNHFNVYLRKSEQMPYYLVSYERDVIRAHALGKFEDLLEAVAHSPAMLLYLDNAQSVGPHSLFAQRAKMTRRPGANKQTPEGLNENYARELMELHTLGVDGGYTQADVVQVARVLTGWTVDRPQLGGGFQFNPNRHEPGTKKVLGVKIKENGEMEGRELLHLLATRPATAQFISRKLAIRFVSDDPPQALVDRMAKAYLESGGDIPTVLKAMFHSPEFWAANDYRAKVKTPLEFVASAARVSNANVENFMPLVNALRQMGMPLYGCVPPVGYKWDEADWVSTGNLVDRMNFALALASNRLPGITVEWAPELDMSTLDSDAPAKQVIPTPESEAARLEPMLVAGGVGEATRAAALEEFEKQSESAPTLNAKAAFRMGRAGAANRRAPADAHEREDQLLAGLLIGSPEFQRR